MATRPRQLLMIGFLVFIEGCSFPQVVPEAKSVEFSPRGEIRLYDRSAAFDAVRVRGVNCNLAKRTDGSWAGTFFMAPIDVSVTENAIRGVGFVMTRERSESGKHILTGQFHGHIYRFEIDSNQALLRGTKLSVTLPGRQVNSAGTTYGSLGELQLIGEAGSDMPPWPQLGFVVAAILE